MSQFNHKLSQISLFNPLQNHLQIL